MLVKIIKCSYSFGWYRNKIGEVIDVDTNIEYCAFTHPIYNSNLFIYAGDCISMDIKEGDPVWVSNNSEDSAIRCDCKRIYVATTSKGLHLCVHSKDEGQYKKGEPGYNTTAYKYVVPVQAVKEMTMTDVEKLVGCKVKIVK